MWTKSLEAKYKSVDKYSFFTFTGDCELAICGGVSNIISPETFIPLCRARMMSATGQCQTFCDTADGYARGEGCGIVILKKLSQVCCMI